LAAADAAQAMRIAGRFGIGAGEPRIDFPSVSRHVRDVIAEIAPHDSVERFQGLGVHVIPGEARFETPGSVIVNHQTIKARRFVIATGSRAAIPPIPGLDEVPYLTNETVFELDSLPSHLAVIGGGPVGCELAQAFRRLGSTVTLIEQGSILPKDDPELSDVVRRNLVREGVGIREGARADRIEAADGKITIHIEQGGLKGHAVASHLLVATGRAPNIENLGLDRAQVETSPEGIVVNDYLRTSNKRIFAIGDVTGGLQFTHMAGYEGGIVVRNAVFKLRAKASVRAAPWVTYTDPELAHVGMTEQAARDAGAVIKVLKSSFSANDRARTDRADDGFIKVIAGRKGRILGASIVGRHAGELILPWVLAINEKLSIKAMAGLIAPYPTFSEISKAVAGSYYTPTLYSKRTRRLVRLLQNLG
jgi:pyruvate/2-oxoglutarate dehydrogenase complex dihydrolipoamide dehydrogenase (E3) component